MDGGLTVTLISVAMFLGTFLLGFIPLLFRLSEKSLQFISILGAGLLCGTALAIVIPEGVGLLEEAWAVSLKAPHWLPVGYWVLAGTLLAAPGVYSVATLLASSSDPPSALNSSDTNVTSTDEGSPPRVYIGIALTVGFTLMFIVDQIGNYFSMKSQSNHLHNSVGITATLGLVIHAAADGFALGAAVATGEVSVQVIVFFAVILHKAPAAFGLVSYLMHTGLDKKYIQGHLLAFSAAAPIVAIATYFILYASGTSPQSQLSATGVGMLFSAGTFLYVATVHVLPEVSSRAGQRPSDLQQHAGPETHQHPHLGLLESLTLILGVGLPVVLALGLHDD